MKKIIPLFCLLILTSCTFYHQKPEVKKERAIPYKITVYKEKKDNTKEIWGEAKENAKRHTGLTQFFFNLY